MMRHATLALGLSALVMFGCGDDGGTDGSGAAGATGGSSSGGSNTGGTNTGGTNSGGSNTGGSSSGGSNTGGSNSGGSENVGGGGGAGPITIQECIDVCNVAAAGECSPFSCDCMVGCGAVVPLASSASCQAQAATYFTCLTADATPCDNACDNEFNAVLTCVVPYCVGGGSNDPNCATAQGCAGN